MTHLHQDHLSSRYWSRLYPAACLAVPILVFSSYLTPLVHSQEYQGATDRIAVVMQASACAPDLVICSDISVTDQHFLDIESCERARKLVRIAVNATDLPKDAVVMIRCRYDPTKVRRSTTRLLPTGCGPDGPTGLRCTRRNNKDVKHLSRHHTPNPQPLLW